MEFIVVITACYTLLLVWNVLTPKLQAAALSQDLPGAHLDFQGAALQERREAFEGLSDQRERFLQVLRDLELDYQTEKISAGDYASMRASVSAELGEVLARLDEAARDGTKSNSEKKAGRREES